MQRYYLIPIELLDGKVIEDDFWPRVWAGQANLDEVSKRNWTKYRSFG